MNFNDLPPYVLYILAAIAAYLVFKILIKLPMYLAGLAFLAALGYAVYRFIWPMLQGVM